MLKSNLVVDQLSDELKPIVKKVINQERITEKEGVILYTKAPLALLGTLANTIREQKNGNKNINTLAWMYEKNFIWQGRMEKILGQI